MDDLEGDWHRVESIRDSDFAEPGKRERDRKSKDASLKNLHRVLSTWLASEEGWAWRER